MGKTSTRRTSRTVKERQLALIEDPGGDLQTVDARELQVEDDWDERLHLQVNIMYATCFLADSWTQNGLRNTATIVQECRWYCGLEDAT